MSFKNTVVLATATATRAAHVAAELRGVGFTVRTRLGLDREEARLASRRAGLREEAHRLLTEENSATSSAVAEFVEFLNAFER